jgi:hypothetical protein
MLKYPHVFWMGVGLKIHMLLWKIYAFCFCSNIYFILSNGSVNRRDYIISAYVSMDDEMLKECMWEEAVSGLFQCTLLESVCTV